MKLSSLNYTVGAACGVLIAVPPLQARIGYLPTAVYYLCAALILLISVLRITRNIRISKSIAMILFFVGLFILITLLSVIRVDHFQLKVLVSFSTLSLIVLLLGITGVDQKTIAGFTCVVVPTACIIGLMTLINYYSVGDISGYSVEAKEGYLTVSRFLGTAMIIIGWHFLCTRRVLYLGVLAWLVLCLAFAQGRGPLIFGFLVLCYMYLSPGTLARLGASKNVRRLLPIAGSVFFLIIAYQGFRVERIRNRFIDLFTDFGSRGVSGARMDIYVDALQKISQSPITGHGFGEYLLKSGVWRDGVTPHNFVLQVMIDSGVVGVLPLVIALVLIVKRYHVLQRIELTNYVMPMYFVFIFQILNLCKSQDFYLTRSFYIFMAFLVGALTVRYARSRRSVSDARLIHRMYAPDLGRTP